MTLPRAFAPNPVRARNARHPRARPVLHRNQAPHPRQLRKDLGIPPAREGFPRGLGIPPDSPAHIARQWHACRACLAHPVITRKHASSHIHHTFITHQPRYDTPEYGVSSPKLSCCTNTPLASMRRDCEHSKRLHRLQHVHVDFAFSLAVV